MGFGDNLAQDLHRVPPWGWAAFAAAGVGVFFYARNKAHGSTTSATPADTAALAGLYGSNGTVGGDLAGSGTATPPSAPSAPSQIPTGPDANPGGLHGGLPTRDPHPPLPPPPAPPAPPAPPVNPPPAPATPRQTYTVQSGDVLWSIGSRYGKSAQDFYNANSGTIEDTARQNGFANSDGGHWIFPGEVLVVPQ